MPKSHSKSEKTSEVDGIEGKLNLIIGLLLVSLGENGLRSLLRKRRADKEIVAFLDNFGLSTKDLAVILNTTESGISNLRAKRR